MEEGALKIYKENTLFMTKISTCKKKKRQRSCSVKCIPLKTVSYRGKRKCKYHLLR